MSYGPLTRRLTELRAAVYCCPEAGHGCEHAKERATAQYYLARPPHEFADVALKCAALVAECNGPTFVSATTVDEAADALDALQKVMVP